MKSFGLHRFSSHRNPPPRQVATGVAFHLQGEDFTLTLEITVVPDEELVQKSQHGVAHRFQLLVDLRSLNLNLL